MKMIAVPLALSIVLLGFSFQTSQISMKSRLSEIVSVFGADKDYKVWRHRSSVRATNKGDLSALEFVARKTFRTLNLDVVEAESIERASTFARASASPPGGLLPSGGYKLELLGDECYHVPFASGSSFTIQLIVRVGCRVINIRTSPVIRGAKKGEERSADKAMRAEELVEITNYVKAIIKKLEGIPLGARA